MELPDYESGTMDTVIDALALEGAAILEAEIDQDEHPDLDTDFTPEHKKLKRELRQEALTRMEEAARTVADFKAVIECWDRLDANRERRERYHELSRSGDDLPLDYGAKRDGLAFPTHIGGVLTQQIQKGNFEEAIYFCPFEIQELMTTDSLYCVLNALSDERKELLFLCGIYQYSSEQIGEIREQSARNIRKVRKTMFRHIWKKLSPTLADRAKKGLPMTREERLFLAEMKKSALDKRKSSK